MSPGPIFGVFSVASSLAGRLFPCARLLQDVIRTPGENAILQGLGGSPEQFRRYGHEGVAMQGFPDAFVAQMCCRAACDPRIAKRVVVAHRPAQIKPLALQQVFYRFRHCILHLAVIGHEGTRLVYLVRQIDGLVTAQHVEMGEAIADYPVLAVPVPDIAKTAPYR